MPGYHFSPHIRFQWQAIPFIVKRHLPQGQVVIEALSTGVVQTLPLAELEAALFAGNLHFEISGRQARVPEGELIATEYTYLALDDCSEKQLATARQRLAVIEPLLPLPPAERTRARVQAHIETVKHTLSAAALASLGCQRLSRATVYRWLKGYRESGDSLRGLIPHTARCGSPGQSRLQPLVERVMADYLEELQGVRTRRPLSYVYDEICLRIQELNTTRSAADQLRPPAKSTLARRRRVFEQGRRARDPKEKQVRAFARPRLPLEWVEIDHTLTDLIVVDDSDHLPLGRLTLTVCIDVRTRYPLGYYLGFEGYSYFAVSECLYHAIQPKQTEARYGTVHQWQAYGLPETLVTDNGKEFMGGDLLDACQLLGIQLRRVPPRMPQWKPHVERLFATFNTGFFHIAPGTTFSNIQERGDYDSQKAACVYLSQIDRAFNRYLVDVYAQSYHRGLRGVPARVWEQAVAGGFVPRLPANVDELHILLGRRSQRTIRRSGINFHYLRYNSPDLLALRLRLDGQAVKIKYHPGDLSTLYVYDPFERRYLTVPALDQEYTQGLSLWKHRIILHQARREAQRVDHTQLAQARRDIQHIFEAGSARRRPHSRQRVNGVHKVDRQAEAAPTAPEDLPAFEALADQLQENERLAQNWPSAPHPEKAEDDWRHLDLETERDENG